MKPYVKTIIKSGDGAYEWSVFPKTKAGMVDAISTGGIYGENIYPTYTSSSYGSFRMDTNLAGNSFFSGTTYVIGGSSTKLVKVLGIEFSVGCNTTDNFVEFPQAIITKIDATISGGANISKTSFDSSDPSASAVVKSQPAIVGSVFGQVYRGTLAVEKVPYSGKGFKIPYLLEWTRWFGKPIFLNDAEDGLNLIISVTTDGISGTFVYVGYRVTWIEI